MHCEKGNPVVRRLVRKAMGLSVGEGGCQATEQWGVMEDNNNRLNQEGEVVPALEMLGALEDMADALDAKIDYLESRLSRAETRLEEVVAKQDEKQARS